MDAITGKRRGGEDRATINYPGVGCEKTRGGESVKGKISLPLAEETVALATLYFGTIVTGQKEDRAVGKED